MKTLEVQIPDEAAEIPQIQDRIAWFVGEQLKIARWRSERADPEVDGIVNGAIEDAAELKESGLGVEGARRQFVQQWQSLQK